MATDTAADAPLPSFPSSSDKLIWDLWMSQHHLPVVTVALELGVFVELSKVPSGMTIDGMATALSLGVRGTEVMLSLLASLGLLSQHCGAYALTDTTRNFLLPTSPYYWGAMLVSDRIDAAHLRIKKAIESDRPDGAAVEWETGELSEERARELTASMHAHSMSAALVAAQTMAPLFMGDGRVTRFLDVAGGSGVFATSVLQRFGHVSATVLELPVVCRLLHAEYIAPGLAPRLDTVSVNMFEEDWPTGYDAHFFSNVWHDWSEAQCTNLAQQSFKALPSGGRILLHEMLLSDGKDGPLTTAGFSMHMLVFTRGRQWSLPQLTDILTTAGFREVHALPAHAYYSVVVGVKP